MLSRKAGEDALALRELLGNPQISDSILGFHAQQAVEKWLKAVMALREIPQTRTHDLGRLSQLLARAGETPPIDRTALEALTIYAVPLRYDELLDAPSLEADPALDVVNAIESWVEKRLGEG